MNSRLFRFNFTIFRFFSKLKKSRMLPRTSILMVLRPANFQLTSKTTILMVSIYNSLFLVFSKFKISQIFPKTSILIFLRLAYSQFTPNTEFEHFFGHKVAKKQETCFSYFFVWKSTIIMTKYKKLAQQSWFHSFLWQDSLFSPNFSI